MTRRDLLQLSRIFHAALMRRAEERATYIARACAGDDALRREVESLLEHADGSIAFPAELANAAVGNLTALTTEGIPPPLTADFTGTARFELRRCLGKGGFGIVYEALDRERGVPVALKLLRATDPAALYRFKREFRTLADLTHTNLVTLHELFSDGDRWFFTMELVRGRSMVDFIRHASGASMTAGVADQVGTMETTEAGGRTRFTTAFFQGVDELRLRNTFKQLVDGLLAIHQCGIVHRDIKPSNVLVTPEGRVVLLDFGIATELVTDEQPTTVAGTPGYMAPEQASGHTISPAADWYSVGVMLYEALTGRLPLSRTAVDVAPQLPAADLLGLSVALRDADASKRPSGADVRRHFTTDQTPIVPAAAAADTRSSALIGRDAHLHALASSFEEVSAGGSVVVFMPGPSGAGKSALLRRFLIDLRERADAPVVIAGRCHERESVPYKAVDGLVDGLARYLERLPAIAAARQLPRDAALIARLFPVLSRVPEVERATIRTTARLDPAELRRRAAAALRELVARISDRTPLVLAIDDLQWGDLDSGSLLQEIVRLPDPPPVLLVMAYRSEDGHAPLVRMMRDSMMADATRRDVRTVHVNDLTLEQAHELARRELAARADVPPERSHEIAQESRGNSFFVHELVHHALTVGGPVRLDTVIRERVAALPVGAQHLLNAIAISAQPITASVAAAAAGVHADPHDALQVLRTARLIRMRESAAAQELEPYHDRIREAVTLGIDRAAAAGWHTRLAAAWEVSGLARAETLVTHFHGAGDLLRTSHYAVLAASAAERALAFLRAAHYYRVLTEVDPAHRSTWFTQVGDALAHAGRGRDAASAYLNALKHAGAETVIELERRAAEQLIRAGYLNEATKVLESLLPKIGVRPPRTEAGAFAGLLARRLLLSVRGIRFRERNESQLAVEERQRIDVLWSIGAPLSLVDLARGNNLHLRAMHLVLRSGEPTRVVRALSTLACSSAIAGAHRDRQTAQIIERGKQLAARIGDPTSMARMLLAEGICHKVVGRWARGREHLQRAIEQLTPCPGVRWEIETGRTLLHDTLFWMGEWRRLLDEIPARLQEAEDYGDLYSVTHVAVRLTPIAHLAADEPERARAAATAGLTRWPSTRFDLQHRWEVCSLIEADLYTRRAADAWDRLRDAWPKLRWTIRAFQNARIEMRFFGARISLARAVAGEPSYLKAASRYARRLERENAPWATALAALVRAGISAACGGRLEAVSRLAAAERVLRETGMAHYAAAAQYRRAQLIGGDEGRGLSRAAATFFKEQKVVDVERIADLLAPGYPSRS